MHGDPADRIITATALVMNATLVTADAAILAMKSGPPRLDAQA
jgi:PIN domain nuclease of toxin-antitoxin system